MKLLHLPAKAQLMIFKKNCRTYKHMNKDLIVPVQSKSRGMGVNGEKGRREYKDYMKAYII